jgi:hypothetical protein
MSTPIFETGRTGFHSFFFAAFFAVFFAVFFAAVLLTAARFTRSAITVFPPEFFFTAFRVAVFLTTVLAFFFRTAFCGSLLFDDRFEDDFRLTAKSQNIEMAIRNRIQRIVSDIESRNFDRSDGRIRSVAA